MNESVLKSALVKRVRAALPRFVVIRHEERFNSGTPDISITGNRRTSWIEVKWANPRFQCPGVQKLMLKRLSTSGYAFYIVFVAPSVGNPGQTLIVDAHNIDDWKTQWTHAREGIDYAWLVEFIKDQHS